MSKKTVFVISAERKDGTIGYLKEGTTAATAMLDSDPINARHFSHEYDKSQIIDWVDRVKNHVSRYADPGTLRIKAFEMRVVDVDLEHDPSWRTELQRHAVAKLNRMEIEALCLEKYEIERRMADD